MQPIMLIHLLSANIERNAYRYRSTFAHFRVYLRVCVWVCLLKRKINGIGNGRGKEKWPKAFRRAENNVKCKWNTRETSARRSVPHKSALKMDAGHRKVCKLYLKIPKKKPNSTTNFEISSPSPSLSRTPEYTRYIIKWSVKMASKCDWKICKCGVRSTAMRLIECIWCHILERRFAIEIEIENCNQ